jgi:hypothetical protein
MPNENQEKRVSSFVSNLRQGKKIILLLLCHMALYAAFAQNVTISVASFFSLE